MEDSVIYQIIRKGLIFTTEEMGIALRNSSYSPNIKERMDHSAAILDSCCNLVAQAEHIPVHLGSMEWGLRKTLDYCNKQDIELEDNSMIAVNNPYLSGTHLNDITVIYPVFFKGEIACYIANKAHHSDIGGRVPGSISLDAKNIFEEGLVVQPDYLFRNGKIVESLVEKISKSSRNPNERAGDLRAQIAANITGKRKVLEILGKYGLDPFKEACKKSIEYTSRIIKKRILELKDDKSEAEDFIEGGEEDIKLFVKMEKRNSRLIIDYTGTSEEKDWPVNAVYGVTLSGIVYTLLSTIGYDLPVNSGLLSSLEINIPVGTLLNPTFPHPVGIGNVETSQRNSDLLFKALSSFLPERVPACCGGSMNNVMIGCNVKNRSWAFYETVGVGMGGRKGKDGIDGIQCNMTNTMNTPIEEIERSFPIMITRYGFRENSCGKGEFRGGNGIVRRYRILSKDVTFTFISDRERHKPCGLFGGLEAEGTEVFLIRKGKKRKLHSKITIKTKIEDEIEIRTAGGGGYGEPGKRSKSAIKRNIENHYVSSWD